MEPFDLSHWYGFKNAVGNSPNSTIIDQVSIDSRRIYSRNALFVALKGTKLDGHQFVSNAAYSGAKFALVEKNWVPDFDITLSNLTLLKVDSPLRAFQEIAKVYRQQFSCKVVAIAGSCGKTMVKNLLQKILHLSKNVTASPESFNSQIGVPLSLFLINKQTDIALIEAGFSQVDEMKALAGMISPNCTILTHIGRKYICNMGSMEAIIYELSHIVRQTSSEGWVMLPDHSGLTSYIDKIHTKTYFWNTQQPDLPFIQNSKNEKTQHAHYTLIFPDKVHEEISPCLGHDYFIDLINLAIKPAWLLGASSERICETLKNYIPDQMRTEVWQSPSGTLFVNEPYGSDPSSIDKALKQFETWQPKGKKIFLFGGLRNEGCFSVEDYARTGTAIAQAAPDILMTIGNHSLEKMVSEIRTKLDIPIINHPSFESALTSLRAIAMPQDMVLIKGNKKLHLDNVIESFHGSIFPNQCSINLAAIESNINLIKSKLGKKIRLMVMVKAFAYGMNDVRICQFLSDKGIDCFGVSYVDEGIALKQAGLAQTIFSVHAAPFEANKVVEWDLEVGVSDLNLINALKKAAKEANKKIKVHLHVDTGMSRFGCLKEDALSLAKEIKSSPELQLEGIMTHFSSADDSSEDDFSLSQMQRFDQVIHELSASGIHIPWKHAANSSALMRFPESHYNMARIGLAIYGLNGSKEMNENTDLRPAVSLTSKIAGINHCKKGDSVSYGRSYIIEQENQRLAVIPIGYFDGLHRNYSGKGYVLIHGKKASMVGKICMDFMMVDITHIPNASIGDPVLIFGEDSFGNFIAPEDFAFAGGSIAHELITCLGPRIPRIFVHEKTLRNF